LTPAETRPADRASPKQEGDDEEAASHMQAQPLIIKSHHYGPVNGDNFVLTAAGERLER